MQPNYPGLVLWRVHTPGPETNGLTILLAGKVVDALQSGRAKPAVLQDLHIYMMETSPILTGDTVYASPHQLSRWLVPGLIGPRTQPHRSLGARNTLWPVMAPHITLTSIG
jgi:hypothetical protein